MSVPNPTYTVAPGDYRLTSTEWRAIKVPEGQPWHKLLIYYGYPSLVDNSQGDLTLAAQSFSKFDVVVLARSSDVNEWANTKTIISKIHSYSPSTIIFGYIDLGVSTQNNSIATIESLCRDWKYAMADGIFLDDFGADYGVTRSRQNSAVNVVHSYGLSVMANAWNLDHVFSSQPDPDYPNFNPLSTPTRMTAKDWFLLESFPLGTSWMDTVAFKTKLDKALQYRDQYHSRIAATSLVPTSVLNMDDYQKYRYLMQVVGFIFSFDCYGESIPSYSSSSNPLYQNLTSIATVDAEPEWDSGLSRRAAVKLQSYGFAGPNVYQRRDFYTKLYYTPGSVSIVFPGRPSITFT
jgi:hypothetical protein